MKKATLLIFLCWVGLLQAQHQFVDVTKEAGIVHKFEVFEGLFGGGACVWDFNKDGLEDLYITSGMKDDVLYKNNGDGTFTNVFEGSGLEQTRHYVTQNASSADFNRDGWPDLFVTTITSRDSVKVIPRAINLLFINQGDGTFEDQTSAFGLDQLNSFSTSSSIGDFNADGFPDIYVGNYFRAYEGELSTIYDADIVNATNKAKGYLLKNRRGKRFKDVFDQYQLDFRAFGFGGVFTDFDRDADADLIVMNDFGYKATPNFLYQNDFPKSYFTDISESRRMDLKINSMATAIGDYNGDGWLDYFFTDIRGNHLLENQGPGQPFRDMADELKLTYYNISWGANFADFDNDGDVDLFVNNGDLNPNCVPMVNQYFENEDGILTEKAATLGLNHYGMGRGSVYFDYDQDGDLDILIVNQLPILNFPEEVSSTTRLFRNDSASGNWLEVALHGQQSEPEGIGVRVEIVAGQQRQIREIDGGSGHISQNTRIAHFGLANATQVDSIIVTWLGGHQQILLNQPANQLLHIQEEGRTGTGGVPRWYFAIGLAVVLVVLWLFLEKKRIDG